MIEVRFRPGNITVTGHAGAGPPGHDLVCAAVSTLVQTLVSSLEELTYDKIKSEIQPGRVVIEYRSLSAHGHWLVDSFFVGIQGVMESHPDRVCISPGGAVLNKPSSADRAVKS